jgi:hypothetical protein
MTATQARTDHPSCVALFIRPADTEVSRIGAGLETIVSGERHPGNGSNRERRMAPRNARAAASRPAPQVFSEPHSRVRPRRAARRVIGLVIWASKVFVPTGYRGTSPTRRTSTYYEGNSSTMRSVTGIGDYEFERS